jgi:hypothetical protein
MKKQIPLILAALAAVVALSSISSAMKASKQRKLAEDETRMLREQLELAKEAAENTASEPKIIYMTETGDTNEITRLQSLLAQREAQLEALSEEQAAVTNRPPRQRESFEERMARMKEEEPEEYAEMIKERSERQQRMRYNLAERTATFMDLDTSMMSDEEKANHELLVAKMSQVWEMTEQFQDPEAPPNREAWQQMRELTRDVRPLMEMERTIMLKQLGTELGYASEDAAAFAEHIDQIYNTTSTRSIPGGRGGDRRGGR